MSITYLEAIRAAQERALREDPNVFIYGQDVGAFGGAFKATKNLTKQFPGRVLDAPISEDAIVGLAVSPSGGHALATCGDGRLRRVDVATLAEVPRPRRPRALARGRSTAAATH